MRTTLLVFALYHILAIEEKCALSHVNINMFFEYTPIRGYLLKVSPAIQEILLCHYALGESGTLEGTSEKRVMYFTGQSHISGLKLIGTSQRL